MSERNAIRQIAQIAAEGALNEGNAGIPPAQQCRDPKRLARIVCAWCNRLLRYEIWPDAKHHCEGGESLTSHGICSECARKVMKENTPMAKLPELRGNSSNGNRANIVNAYELESTHAALKAAPEALAEAAGRMAALRHDLIEVKQIKLLDAKVALDRAITGATMEAYGSGAITGKNQAERDLQVAHHIDNDEIVRTAKLSLRHWEVQLAGIEARLEIVEGDYKAAWARLSAVKANAALQTAYLQFLAGQSGFEAESVNTYEHPF